MIKVIFLIGQPGIGKSTLSMGLEEAMGDVCDLCVIQNHDDRDYQAEEAEAKAMGYSSMQDAEYKKQYGKEKLQESRRKHGERIVAAHKEHIKSEDQKDFVVLIHIPVRTTLEQYKWCEEDYQRFIQQTGYEGEISFLPSLILTPNLKKHMKAETLAVLNQRYEQRCTRQEIKTDQLETDPEKIALQRSLDAGLNVSRQYALIQMALRQLEGANRLRLDLHAPIETNRTALVTALTETIHGWQQQVMQTIAPSNSAAHR